VIGVGIEELELGKLLGVVLQEPGVVDHRHQNERLPRRQRGAVAAHDRARREARTRQRQRLREIRPAAAAAAEGIAAAGEIAEIAGAGLAAELAAVLSARALAASRWRWRRHQRAEPRREILGVIFADRFIADAAHHLVHPRLERGAPLRRVERGRFGLAAP